MSFPDPGQLLRQAADKELLATSLTRYVKAMEEVFVGALANPQTVEAFWKGPAARRFNTQAAQLGREIELLRETCAATADRLRKQAELLRKEAAQLPS
ncbi:hypothetical protein ETD86_10805 [Nonomuraea turkmeniaca]|uniref:WXG100 family type VII secretion target n=1 Tax=Nonomuraea turkmeniaca TaxID=103838 RepID=A0A5S4FPL2_9ACTN|nr:hypothetical protein [Nonomuraea turkmeniaca]TMR22618.1 hypothetical protein ETD86_10805 [Nonomuraea turkmeniaca]